MHDKSIEEYLEGLESPALRDPQRHDPNSRLSKATARAIMQALYYLDFAEKRGYYVHDFIDRKEIKRAKVIMTNILISETEETL